MINNHKSNIIRCRHQSIRIKKDLMLTADDLNHLDSNGGRRMVVEVHLQLVV